MLAAILALAVASVRIVSLAPSLTEDLFAIGAGPQVVGVDAYSNRPAAAARLPRVGAMQTINSERILTLRPDVVVGIAYNAPQLVQLHALGITTEALKSDTLADDFNTIAELGRLTGHAREASALLARMRDHIARVRRATSRLAAPRALVVISTQPIYTAGGGSYIGDLLAAAHVDNVGGSVAEAFPNISAEVVERADPDVIVSTTTMKIDPTVAPWSRLRAVRDHHFVLVPEDDLFRPGPNVARVLDDIVRAIAPYRPGGTGGAAKVTTRPSGS
jgi:iron complex transport system substrate-binding protein